MSLEQSPPLKAKKARREDFPLHNTKSKDKIRQLGSRDTLRTNKPSDLKIDFIKLLPAEIRELLLLYLDERALTATCCVSKTWNKLIGSSCRVWRQACHRLDLVIRDEEEDIDDENYWRSLFLKMYKRRYQMLNSQSFVNFTYKSRVPLTAIYYHNGKLATASAYTTKIKIWECSTFVCLLTVMCNSWISSVKFDDFVIMVATDHAGIQCWDIKLGCLACCYLSDINFVSSFDYDSDIDLVVGGFHSNAIYAWEMSTAKKETVLNGHSSAVAKVMLRSYLVDEGGREQQYLLLSMDSETIFVRLISSSAEARLTSRNLKVVTWYKISFEYRPCVPRRLAPKVGHYVRLIAQSSSSVLLLSPKCIFSEACDGFLSMVFKFDGEFLYFAFQGDNVSLCKWDLKSTCLISEAVDQPGKIKAMLGIGMLYMTFVALWENGELFFLVVDKKRKNAIAWIPLPTNAKDESVFEPQFHRSRLCLGEKCWLDGFDAKNDQGVVLVTALDSTQLFILQWKSEEQRLIPSYHF